MTNKRLRSYMSGEEGVVASSYNYDNEGRQTSGTGGMTYDSMGRPLSGGGITSVTYGPGDEPMQIVHGNNNYVEHRTYNLLGQLSRQTYKYWSTVLADFEYAYVDGANNGRISRFKDWVTGEEVNYLYDSLNRLNRAETTGPEWGQSFTYDGFGNLTAETATKGVAPSYTLQYDWATNRIVSPGFAYDANGNLTTIPGVGTASYDVLNRYHDYYGRLYRDDNKLLSRLVGTSREVYYYGPTGLLETVWSWTTSSDGGYTFRKVREYNYFAGRRVEMGRLTDRLGSVRAVVSTIPPTMRLASYSYYPYGQERQVTSDEQYKFATYFRESNGLDYAGHRYYTSQVGRFLTPDPYGGSGTVSVPGSWNRYAYVEGDPINLFDPNGLTTCWYTNYPEMQCREEITVYAEPDIMSVYLQWYQLEQNSRYSLSYQPNPWEVRSESAAERVDRLFRQFAAGYLNDCEALTAFATQTAMAYHWQWNNKNIDYFVQDFAVFVPEKHPAVKAARAFGIPIAAMNSPIYLKPENGSGFQDQYVDSLAKKTDQLHHFAAFFQFGYYMGQWPGYIAGTLSDLLNPGDQRLARAAVDIGVRLKNGSLTVDGVASAISDLCKKR